MTQAASPAPSRSARREIIELVATVTGGLLLALVVRIFLFQPFTIPSSSMEPGLQVGDYIVVSKFAYGWSGASLPLGRADGPGRLFERAPKRGDVVVFRLPRDPSQVLIKRVIGLPGDRVRMSGGVVQLNGAPVQARPSADGIAASDAMTLRERLPDGRSWLTYDRGPGYPGDDTETVVVPDGRYLVLGDNRDNSLDSRWPADTGVGLLPAENLIGRADLILMSWKPGAAIYKPWTWLNLRWGRGLAPIH